MASTRGRKVPTAVKIARGTLDPSRVIKDEPKPADGHPDCPDYLEGIATEAFDTLCITLDEMGMLSKTDTVGLELLASQYAVYRQCLERIQADGVIVNGKHTEVSHPAGPMLRGAFANIKTMLVEFGLTPLARSKISASGAATKADPFDEFLKRRKG